MYPVDSARNAKEQAEKKIAKTSADHTPSQEPKGELGDPLTPKLR
jgi:hypothetical protein